MAAINKIEVGAGISILPTLGGSLSKLQELAGFDLSGSCDPFYNIDSESLIPKYIGKWVNTNNCLLRPTWRNFLTVLKDLKEVVVAEEIEKYLTESTANIEENDEETTKFDGNFKILSCIHVSTWLAYNIILAIIHNVMYVAVPVMYSSYSYAVTAYIIIIANAIT